MRAQLGRGDGEPIAEWDLHAIVDLVNVDYDGEPADGLPRPILDRFCRLVPSDSVCLFELDARHRHCGGEGCVHEPGLAPVFWRHYWDCPP